MLAVIFLVMASASLSLGTQDCGLISPNVESALSDSRTSSDGQDESTNRIIGGRNVLVEGLPWQVLHSPVVVLSGKRVKCLKTLQVWLKSRSRLELCPLFPHLGEEHPFYMTLCEVLWWKLSRSVTKNLTANRFNSGGWGLDDMKREIHSFPTM